MGDIPNLSGRPDYGKNNAYSYRTDNSVFERLFPFTLNVKIRLSFVFAKLNKHNKILSKSFSERYFKIKSNG